MKRSRIAALGAVVLIVLGSTLAVATLLTNNALFLASAWRLPAAATLLLVILVTIAFAKLGRPGKTSTPYW